MQIRLNGESREFNAPQTVTSLLDVTGFGGRRVAVEVNREIVPKSRHSEHALADGDQVEIIQAMGGG